MDSIAISRVRLRKIESDDLPQLYAFNLDPQANWLAATIPRGAAAFKAHWEKILADPDVIARAIVFGDLLAGSISTFKRDGFYFVGYWIGQEFWGRGIASRALELLLNEVAIRPLHAQVATSNQASLRILLKCGFIVRSIQAAPATDRNLACEEAFLVLE